jgi:hypothetical protein
MVIKVATFLVDSIASNIIGRFRVFRTGQSTSADKPTFDSNPGSAVGSESTEVRGAFRVRKSTEGTADGEKVIFEALPNGSVNANGGAVLRAYTSPVATAAKSWKKLFEITFQTYSGDSRFFYIKIISARHDQPERTATSFVEISTRTSGASAFLYGAAYYIIGPRRGSPDLQIGYTGSIAQGATITVWMEISSWGYIVSMESPNLVLSGEGWTTTDPGLTYFSRYRLLDEGGAAITGTAASTSPATGALTVAGGAGIAGMLNVGGAAAIAGVLTAGTGGLSSIKLNGNMIEFYQGGVMKISLKLATISGVLGLLLAGAFSCDSFYGKGNTFENSSTGIKIAGYTISGITYGNGKFVAVGEESRIFISTDGTNWTIQSSGTGSIKNLLAITFGNGKFVAVGRDGAGMVSSDGVTWTGYSVGGATVQMRAVAYGNGLFVAVGDAGNIYSSEGAGWTHRPAGTGAFSGITYGNGVFVVVGSAGTIRTSPDWITWTSRSSGVSSSLNGVIYGKGLFVAVGTGGVILTSPDGITWTSRSSGTTNDLLAITYGNGVFVVVGSQIIYISPDTITWTSRSSGVSGYFSAIAYGNGFVAVGQWNNYSDGVVYKFNASSDNWAVAGGFTERAIVSGKRSYKLFDGKWINLNSDGSVTWS